MASDGARYSRVTVAGRRPGCEGLTELVRRYWTPLVTCAARLLHSADAAEDVVQQTFTRVWERRASWQPLGTVKSFLYQITRRLAIDETRRLRRRTRFFQRHRNELRELPSRRPVEGLAGGDARAGEMRADGDAAIAAPPPRQREIFVLARYHGLSHPEIAEALGVSRATVSSHRSSALGRLQHELSDVGDLL